MTIHETLEAYRQTLAVIQHLNQIKTPIVQRRPKKLGPKMGRTPKYPWKTLGLDHDFLVPCAPTSYARKQVMNSLTSCIANIRRRYGKNFAQRTDPKGVRVTRIA